MPINPDIFRTYNKEWEQLASELNRNEWEHCSRILTNPETGEVWFPRPWIEALNETPALRTLTKQIKPLEPKDLAPMTPKLRELAKLFGLPEYKGKAKPNPPPAPPSKMRAQHPRERCPRCGGWMAPAEVVEWEKKNNDTIGYLLAFPKPEDCSGKMVCKDCGHTK